MLVTDADERLQPVANDSENWSDSLYFNAWDPSSGLFLIARLAVRANAGTSRAGVLAWIDGFPFYAHGERLEEIPPSDWDVMPIGGLTSRMVRSNQEWTLQLAVGEGETQQRAFLTWDGLSAPFAANDSSSPLPSAVASGHYEQTSRVHGDIDFGGRTIHVEGIGQRDHTWGVRDWSGVTEWHWITGFVADSAGPGAAVPAGDTAAFSLFHVLDNEGRWSLNGYVHRGDSTVGVVTAERETSYEDRVKPTDATVTLTLTDGSTVRIALQRAAMEVPIKPTDGPDTVVHETPMTVTFHDGAGPRSGYGIYEFVENHTNSVGPRRGAAGADTSEADPSSRSMTHAETREFLSAGTRTGKLATVRTDGRPHVVPIWFVVDDDDSLVFMTGADTMKGKAMARDRRVSLCVDDETPPYSFVMIDGAVTMDDDLESMLPWAVKIGGRYMGLERAEEFGRRNCVRGEVLVRVTPTNVVARKNVASHD